MTRRGARFLTHLYPPAWRARYGEEFQAFLESRRVLLFETLNIVASALSERVAGSLTTLLYAFLAAIAAGGALYLTSSGAPLAQIVETYRALWLCWAVIEAMAFAMLAVGAVAVIPVAFAFLRKPGAARKGARWKLVWLGTNGLLLALFLAVGARAGDKLIVLGLLVNPIGDFWKYVVAHSKLSRSLGRVKLAVVAMARSIVFMTLMAVGYGSGPHSVFGARPYVFWSFVLTLLATGAISGAEAARRLDSGRME